MLLKTMKRCLFKKSELIRMPVRLGEDAFYNDGVIRREKIENLMHTISAFRHLMIVQNVLSYRACATSAMREAANSGYIVDYIKDRTGISIDIIDGQQEAELVYSNRIVETINNDRSFLYVDVGGGSTEITLFANKKVITSESFNIGTIRFLNGEISQSEFTRMKNFLKDLTSNINP
jgi:exopolyphosphatase / guanosine-5'-triphosphate,3'-diphosphate pyrophosphatase